MVFFSLFIFILGLAVGSFLSCLIYRLETEQDFISGRSFCPHCRHVLNWPDLIPLVSFILLRRSCRYCHKPIPWQDFLVEILTGLVFLALSIYQFNPFNLLLFSFFIVIFVFDLKHYLIPDEIVYSAILVALFYRLLEFWMESMGIQFLLNYLLSGLGACLFFWSIYLLSRGKGLGFGDVKLAFLMGLFLGFPNIVVALFFAFLSGAIIGTGLMMFKKKTLKSELPFAPFLIAGTALAFFAGSEIAGLYLRLLF